MKIDYQIKILKKSFIAIENSKKFYNSRLEGLGEEFLKEIITGIDTIHNSPLLFPISYSTYRKYVCARFPFRIFYKVNKRKHLIIIVGVRHEKQNLNNL